MSSSSSSGDHYYDDYSSSDSEANLVGEIVSNKYVLLYKLGQGAFASVFMAMNLNDKKYYAIKLQDDEEAESAYEEVGLLKKFSGGGCRNLIGIVEHFVWKYEDVEYVCMVLELMAGSVYDIMRVGMYSKGLPMETVKSVMRQLLVAMDVIANEHCTI